MSEYEIILNRADSAVISRDYSLATRLYKSLLEKNSEDKTLLFKMGYCLIMKILSPQRTDVRFSCSRWSYCSIIKKPIVHKIMGNVVMGKSLVKISG